MGEALDPEDVRILLRRYYDVARDTVNEHGGILEKFIGDAVGKSQPIRALPLLGRAMRQPVAKKTRLIGRDADLQQLELVARRALQEQRPFLVSIIAPAGVGKSRLLEEFIDRLPAIEPRA